MNEPFNGVTSFECPKCKAKEGEDCVGINSLDFLSMEIRYQHNERFQVMNDYLSTVPER